MLGRPIEEPRFRKVLEIISGRRGSEPMGQALGQLFVECERMRGVDALDSGVVTSWDAAATPPKPRVPKDPPVTWKNWD